METTDTPASGAGPTVLILDDEEPIRIAARRILERYDYRVLTAANAHEASGIV